MTGARVFEIERDRFALMCSREVEVGECLRVVLLDDVVEALRRPEYACIDYPDPADFIARELGAPEDGE